MNDPMLEKLLHSKNYQCVCPDTVRRIYVECCQKYKKPKDAEKAAREQLHGLTGAFLTRAESAACMYDMHVWATSGHRDADLERALTRHASTRERLPLARMDGMYKRIFEVSGAPNLVLDLACGLNPLYLGARGIPCTGVDVSGEAVDDINACASNYGLPIRAVCADLLCENAVPKERYDLALLFKILPLLERQKSGTAMDVMRTVNAKYLAVSFPTRTLGGRNVGMEGNYSAWMENHLPENRRVAARFTEENELFYILEEMHNG